MFGESNGDHSVEDRADTLAPANPGEGLILTAYTPAAMQRETVTRRRPASAAKH
jgi:hypothetical protein